MIVKQENSGLGLSNRAKVRRIALDGVMAALGVVLMLLIRFPLVPAAPYMLYDGGDIPAMVGAMMVGPWHGLLILGVICLVQMVTPNSSGFYGLLMHFLASGVLVFIPAFVWKRRQSQKSLVAALLVSVLLMTALMIPLNLLVTPLFLGVGIDEVMKMIVPILLPFNLVKGLLNAVATYLIYRGLRGLMKLSRK